MTRLDMYRRQAVNQVRARLERLDAPRLHMSAIVALTGASGFVASFAMLAAGVETMWLRYVCAVLISYAVFLLLLWFWLRWRGVEVPDAGTLDSRASSEMQSDEGACDWLPQGGQSGGGGASADFDAVDGHPTLVPMHSALVSEADPRGPFDGMELVPALGDADEALPLVAIMALVLLAIGLASAAFWIIGSAPVFLAELLVDAALVGGLYKRVHRIRGDRWWITAMRRTLWVFVLVAFVLGGVGAFVQHQVPDAVSIGDML